MDPTFKPAAKDTDDSWGAYSTERREIANFIFQNGIEGLWILSADVHLIGFDDGSHSQYADNADGVRGPYVFQTSALYRRGGIRGGPYSHGCLPGPGHFGMIQVTDFGHQICVKITSHERDLQIQPITYDSCAPTPGIGQCPLAGIVDTITIIDSSGGISSSLTTSNDKGSSSRVLGMSVFWLYVLVVLLFYFM